MKTQCNAGGKGSEWVYLTCVFLAAVYCDNYNGQRNLENATEKRGNFPENLFFWLFKWLFEKKMPSDTSVFSIVAYSVNVNNMCRNEIESACMICDVFPFHNYSFRVVSEAASELHPWYFWKAT